MAAPTVSHLDPLMMRAARRRARAARRGCFSAPEGSFAFAVSGTGTSGMETAVANLVREGTRAPVVVTGYFGDRLAQMCERYGATVTRLDVEWGRACDPDALRDSAAGDARRRRGDGARGNVHRRAESGAGAGRDRARARRADDRRRGHVVRRSSARRRRVGHRRRATAARRSASAGRRAWRRSSSRRARSSSA